MGVLVGLAEDDPMGFDAVASRRCPLRMVEIILIDCENVAAEPRHGLKLYRRRQAPGLAVVAGAVEEALPGPASAGEAVDALEDRKAASK